MTPAAILLGKSGFLLFAIGLALGLAIPAVRNPRMALSAHLTAVPTGPALIAAALFWPQLNVPRGWEAVIVYGLIASSYILVGGIFVAAILGASRSLPIAGAGHRASGGGEALVSLLVKGSSLVMIVAVGAICLFMLA